MKSNETHLNSYFVIIFYIIFSCRIQGQVKSSKVFGNSVNLNQENTKNHFTKCGTVHYEQYLQNKNSNRRTSTQFEKWIAPLIAEQKNKKSQSKSAATTITIPVVVHVIHNGEAIGTAPNISDAQVQSQITVLNQDFRRKLGTRGYNTNPVGADVEVEFVLAKQDPDGNPTNGIERMNLNRDSWTDEEIENIVKPNTIWDSTQYMNMWSVNFPDSSDILGYAQFPDNSTLAGIPKFDDTTELTDGVVAKYNVFGSNDFGSGFLLDSKYNKGRTMTHEVGHYLGLLHIWGDGFGSEEDNDPDCTATDYCADTPQSGWEHYDCKMIYDTCPLIAGNDMPENYMDYTNDTCMNIFTQDQKNRILTVLSKSPRRLSLTTSIKGNAIPLFANDAQLKIYPNFSETQYIDCSSTENQENKQITIKNVGTATMTSATINYSINSGANQTQTWTGSLAPYQTAYVTLLNTKTNGLLIASIDLVNGQKDQRSTNNTGSFAFSPLNYEFKNFVFNLQLDKAGSDIRWDLKNGSGNVVYSGGPYTNTNSNNLRPIITENWTLENNECYTFTINDTQNNGLCCSNGNGFYTIKSANNAVEIASGDSFEDQETVSFTTNTLKNNLFEKIDEINWYPNPSKDLIRLYIPEGYGLPESISISNSLGQIISKKAVFEDNDLILNISSFHSGIYFLTIAKESQTKTTKIIKE